VKKTTEALKKADLNPGKSETSQTIRKSRTYLKTDDLLSYFRNEGNNENSFRDDGVEYFYKNKVFCADRLMVEESVFVIDKNLLGWSGLLYLKREIQEVKE
jgi:hypothetical protein